LLLTAPPMTPDRPSAIHARFRQLRRDFARRQLEWVEQRENFLRFQEDLLSRHLERLTTDTEAAERQQLWLGLRALREDRGSSIDLL